MRRKRFGDDTTEAKIGRDVQDIMRGRPVQKNTDPERDPGYEAFIPEESAPSGKKTKAEIMAEKKAEKKRRKELMITECKLIKKNRENKNWFFEKIKIDKTFAESTEKKEN